MKLHTVLMARIMWFFDLSSFNPRGLNLWPIFERLINKYQFAGPPKNLLDLDSEKALSFKFGSFINSRRENVNVSLSVYSNGISATAFSSTEDAEEFLQEAVKLVAEEFQLVLPQKITKVYISQLDVESDLSLDAMNPGLAKLAEFLTARVATVDDKPRKFDFGALQFWTDDWQPASSPAYFRFERKVGLPFSSNRYFSQAGLKTHEHLEFLKALEDVLKSASVNAHQSEI